MIFSAIRVQYSTVYSSVTIRDGWIIYSIVYQFNFSVHGNMPTDTLCANGDKKRKRKPPDQLTVLTIFHTSDNSRVNSVVLYNSREWKYHHSVVLYNSPESKVLPLSCVV